MVVLTSVRSGRNTPGGIVESLYERLYSGG